MSVLINGKLQDRQEYLNEDELQKYLFEQPELLMNSGDVQFHSVGRELYLPSGGKLDILLLDSNGGLVAVEVKLNRNAQARREVVAQIFDYISDISTLDYHSLDEISSGRLDILVQKMDSTGSLPKRINRDIHNGVLKVIIAVDEANEGLKRIMEFVNDRTSLDVRLVEIEKYSDGKTLMPKIVIEGNDELPQARSARVQKSNPKFEELIEYHNSSSEEEFRTKKKSKGFALIVPNSWPSSIHYEYLDKPGSDVVGIEFHIESRGYEELKRKLVEISSNLLDTYTIQFDGKWSGSRGRVYVDLSYSLGKEKIVSLMKQFILETSEPFGEIIKKLMSI